MDKLVSLIIPAYNADKYLKECLDSVINQTYKNIEIVLINDGSKDNTDKICKEYASKDARINFINKENTGVSSTRNMALNICKGEYVLFVDSDDWIKNNCIELLINNVADADILKFNCSVENANHEWVVKNFKEKEHVLSKEEKDDLPLNVISPNKYEDKFGYYGEFGYVCGKLYSKNIIQNIYFNEKMRFCEDGEFFLKVIKNDSKIKCIDEVLYYYRHNKNSCMNRFRNDIIEESKIVCYNMEETLNDSNLFSLFKIDRFGHCLANLSLKKDLKYKDVKLLCKDNYWNMKELKKHKKDLTSKRKILFVLAYYKLYLLLYLVCKIKNNKKEKYYE